MGDFTKRVPGSSAELKENLRKLHENVKHVSKIWVDESTGRLMVDLDWSANKFGGDAGADFYMPVRKGKRREAEELAQRLIHQSRAGFAPSDADAELLFSYIDPAGD